MRSNTGRLPRARTRVRPARVDPAGDRGHGGGLFVEVCDCGRFSAGLQAPDLESAGGRGIPIIAAVVDHLELLPTPDRTRIRFGKRVSVAGPAVQAS